MKVDFHTGVADKLGAACRFLRKAHEGGATVTVCADPVTLDQLDRALWSFEPQSFVAHVRVKGGAQPASPTPTRIWLVDNVASIESVELLLNLGPDQVEGWERFARVVEIVSGEPADADAGRQRWRQYSAHRGLELVHHARAAGA